MKELKVIETVTYNHDLCTFVFMRHDPAEIAENGGDSKYTSTIDIFNNATNERLCHRPLRWDHRILIEGVVSTSTDAEMIRMADDLLKSNDYADLMIRNVCLDVKRCAN